MPTTSTVKQAQDLNVVLHREFDRSYNRALAAEPNWSGQMMRTIPTNQESVKFPFRLNNLDERVVPVGTSPEHKRILFQDVTIEIQKFMPDGISLRRTQFGDPFYSQIVRDEVAALPGRLMAMRQTRLINALVNGDTDAYYTMYDGQQLFSSAHVVGDSDATFDNLDAGLLTGSKLNDVITNLMQVPAGPGGKPYPVSGATFWLIVPPALNRTAREILNSSIIPQDNRANENPDKGIARLITENQLVDDNDWYVVMTVPGMQPFVHLDQDSSINGSRRLVSEIDPSIHVATVHNQDLLRWSVVSFEEVFPTHFWMMTKVVNA